MASTSAETVYLMQGNGWVKVGISDDPERRRRSEQGTEILRTWRIGHDARLVEEIACRLLIDHLDWGREWFSCGPDVAHSAIEKAVEMAWRGDFSVFRKTSDVPKKYRGRYKLLRPDQRHKPIGLGLNEDQHVRAFWNNRRGEAGIWDQDFTRHSLQLDHGADTRQRELRIGLWGAGAAK